MPINFDRDTINSITIDGDSVSEVTMDGDVVWSAAISPVEWSTASDWDNAKTEVGVVHEDANSNNFAYHTDPTSVKKGYASGNRRSKLDYWWPLNWNSANTDTMAEVNQYGYEVNQYGPTEGWPFLDLRTVEFDGSDDRLWNNSEALYGSSNDLFSGSFWFYPETYDQTQQLIEDRMGIDIRFDDLTSNGISMRVYGDNTGSIGPTGISQYDWHFVTYYWDIGNEIGISVDNSSYYTYSTTQGLNDNYPVPHFSFGQNNSNGDPDLWFKGSLYDIRMYDSILSQSEIQDHWDAVQGESRLTTSTKSTGGSVKPAVRSSQGLPQGTVKYDVIGSPGTTSEEVNTVTVNGNNTYNEPTWSNKHSNFEVKLRLSQSDITTDGPTVNSVKLTKQHVVIDSAEDGDIAEYSGNTGQFSAATDSVNFGSYSIKGLGGGGHIYSTSGLGTYPSPGDKIEYWTKYYSDGFGSGLGYVHYGVQDSNNYYSVGWEINNKLGIYKTSGGSQSELVSTGINTGNNLTWERVTLDWQSDGTMVATCTNGANAETSISTTDTSFTSQGIGFGFDNGSSFYDNGYWWDEISIV